MPSSPLLLVLRYNRFLQNSDTVSNILRGLYGGTVSLELFAILTAHITRAVEPYVN